MCLGFCQIAAWTIDEVLIAEQALPLSGSLNIHGFLGLHVIVCESSDSVHVQNGRVHARHPLAMPRPPRSMSQAGSTKPSSSEGLLAKQRPRKHQQVGNPAPLLATNYQGA